jgi:hypothetical protein
MSGPIEVRTLDPVIDLQRRFAGLHPVLGRCYPIAVVSEGSFHIYDLNENSESYRYVRSKLSPIPVPEGVRAAFPLEEYGGKMACVVTPEVFDDLGGYITILHEFIHCYQFKTCEAELKRGLRVAWQAEGDGEMMWEIQYPFPYADAEFVDRFKLYLSAANTGDLVTAEKVHQDFKAFLNQQDYEYMVWQEWKEGFARYIENRLREALGLPLNNGGMAYPYNRVSFYASGAALIGLIHQVDRDLVVDLPALFMRLFTQD